MTWAAFGQALPEAVGIAISPVPIVLVILMLVSARAKVNGPAFTAGWMAGVLAVAGAAFLLADVSDAATDPDASDGVAVSKLVFGVVFFALAHKQWKRRPKPGEEPPTPKLFAAVDTMGGAKAGGLGFVACVANPKNLPLEPVRKVRTRRRRGQEEPELSGREMLRHGAGVAFETMRLPRLGVMRRLHARSA